MGSSVGGIVGGLFGGDTPSAPNVTTYQPTGTAAFDQTFQNLVNNRVGNNPYTAYAPQATATFNQAYTNPFAPAYQTAANTAGAAYGAQGTADTTAAGALTSVGNTGLTGANQVLQQGLDPQSALYTRSLQQLNDQVNANEAQRGITSSPYGASVANSAASNFGIDWQNNQLQRAIQGLNGYTAGVAGANADFAGADTLGTAGASNQAKAGAVPYAASTDINNSQSAALNQLLSVLGNSGAGTFDANTLDQLMSYLQLGTGQSNQQAQLDLDNYANQLAASKASQSGLGSLASSVSNVLGGQNGSGYAMALNALIA